MSSRASVPVSQHVFSSPNTPPSPGMQPAATGEGTFQPASVPLSPAANDIGGRCAVCGGGGVPLTEVDRFQVSGEFQSTSNEEPLPSPPSVGRVEGAKTSSKRNHSAVDSSHSSASTEAFACNKGEKVPFGVQTSMESALLLDYPRDGTLNSCCRRQTGNGEAGRVAGEVAARLSHQAEDEVLSPGNELPDRGSKTLAELCESSGHDDERKLPTRSRERSNEAVPQESTSRTKASESDHHTQPRAQSARRRPPYSGSCSTVLAADEEGSAQARSVAAKRLLAEKSGGLACSACRRYARSQPASGLDVQESKLRYSRTSGSLTSQQGTHPNLRAFSEKRDLRSLRSMGLGPLISFQAGGRTSGIPVHRCETAWRRLARRGTAGDSSTFSRKATWSATSGSPISPTDVPVATSILYSTGSLRGNSVSTPDHGPPSMFEELLRSGTLLTAEEANMKANLEKLLIMVATSPVSFGDLTKTGLSQDCLLRISKLRRQRRGADPSTTLSHTGQQRSRFWCETARLGALFGFVTGGAGREGSSPRCTSCEPDKDVRGIYSSALFFAAQLVRVISCGRVSYSRQAPRREDTTLRVSTPGAEGGSDSPPPELTRPRAAAAAAAGEGLMSRSQPRAQREDGRASDIRRRGSQPEEGYASVSLVLVAMVAAIGTAIVVGRFCSGSDLLIASQRETDGWVAGLMSGLKAGLQCPSGHSSTALPRKGNLCG